MFIRQRLSGPNAPGAQPNAPAFSHAPVGPPRGQKRPEQGGEG